MTKTRSKTGVKVAVATAALFVAAAAALMINTESGTDTVTVNFCVKFDKGIVVQESANDALQTLTNGCQKSGWGMSNVSYACGGIDNAYSNSDDGYWNSDDGKGAEKGGAAFYKMSWQPCAGGAVVIEDFPNLIISVAADTPAPNNFSSGDKDLTLASFDFSSNPNAFEPANLKITELVVSVASSGPRNCLNNFRLVNEGKNNVAAPVLMADVKKKTASYSSSVLFSNISAVDIDTEAKRTLSVIADVSDQKICAGKSVKLAILPDYSSDVGIQMPVKVINLDAEKGGILIDANILYLPNAGKSPLSTLKLGTSSQLKADIFGVNANEFVFYTTKLMTSLSADSPQGIFAPGYNTTIGKFKVCNGPKDALVQYMNFQIYDYQLASSNNYHVKVFDPVTSDVYLDIVFPGKDNYKTYFKDNTFKDAPMAANSCRGFNVSLDTVGFNQVFFNVSEVIWADSLIHNIAANGNTLPTPTKVLIK